MASGNANKRHDKKKAGITMKTYGIYKISGNNTFCCWIDAKSERAALVAYRDTKLSSEIYNGIVKGLRSYSLITGCAEYVAIESGKNR